MADQVMIQLLRTVARLEAGSKQVVNERLAKEAISRGLLIQWRDSYVRTRLGRDVLRREISAGARTEAQVMHYG